MDVSKFAKGLEASPFDSRDYSLSSVSPVIMRYPDVCPPPFNLTIKNQGSIPSCVGNSSSSIKQEKNLRQRVASELDAELFYKRCKEIDGYPGPGTFFRVGMKLLKDEGIKSLDSETKYKISQYALIDDMSFEGLKKAIFLYGAVLVGFRGSNEGWQGEYIRAPKAGETIWGHAVTLVGYEKDYLIGQNSWGTGWGNQGLFKVPKDYLPFEGWAIVVDQVAISAQPIKTGFLANNFIKLINGMWKTTANVNVRSDAGTSFGIIKTIPNGTVVQITNAPTKPANGLVWQQILIV
jgi:hypothetical protein